ncbi:LCP family protein [Acetivibrio cellulolyticus]|uniref:LCP family protein n=1 Tax=Acetivibrio cellulolyticus TaxID=35830 RepID=UPI0001E2D168|nr:LCP family protein [Acetivibrio cellulolyticus]
MGKKKSSKNGFKKNVFIWLSVFVVITVSVFTLGKLGLLGKDNTEALSTFESQPTIDPIDITDKNDQYIPKPSNISTPGKIDYDSIAGLTNENLYSEQLVTKGSKNILFVGSDKLSGLYDTIGILSIDKENEKLKLIMIPRDLHIDYNEKVRHYLEIHGKADNPGFYKINCAHNIGPYLKYKGKFEPYSMNFLAGVIKEKFGIEVDDYVKINPEGFVEMVDLFGGVDLEVPYDMNYDDPYQDLSIHLKKGMQQLNGKEAEGFVRFRQGYNTKNEHIQIGDVERKNNQLKFINAFIKQHGTISNIDKLPGLINTLNKNLKHSIGVGDLLTSYIGYAKDAITKKYEIESTTLSGKAKMVDGSYFIYIN